MHPAIVCFAAEGIGDFDVVDGCCFAHDFSFQWIGVSLTRFGLDGELVSFEKLNFFRCCQAQRHAVLVDVLLQFDAVCGATG
jgi:hypothetical protein